MHAGIGGITAAYSFIYKIKLMCFRSSISYFINYSENDGLIERYLICRPENNFTHFF